MLSALLLFSSLVGVSGEAGHSVLIAKHRRKTPHTRPFPRPLPEHNSAQPHKSPRMAIKSIYGSVYDTYIAMLDINGQLFHVVLDTGSSDTAVAVGPGSGCKDHYSGVCRGPPIEVLYDEGNWTGHACYGATVKLGTLSAGKYVFAGMETQYEMLECSGPSVIGHHRLEGIVGLAYPSLVGPPADYTIPLFDAIVKHEKIEPIFAFQSCGWDGLMLGDPLAHGHLDLGRIHESHYSGEIVYTPVTKKDYYNVQVTDVLLGTVSVMPTYRHNNITKGLNLRKPHFVDDHNIREMPDTIIDSGTSAISFTKDLFANLMAEMRRQVPSMPEDAWRPNGAGDARCLRDTEVGMYPVLTIEMIGEKANELIRLTIPSCRYWMSGDKTEGVNCPGYVFQLDQGDMEDGNIIGSVAYEAYYVVHDNSKEPNRVGFAALAGCQTPHMCAVLGQDATIEVSTPKGWQVIDATNAAVSTGMTVDAPQFGLGMMLLTGCLFTAVVIAIRAALPPTWKVSMSGYDAI